MRVRGDGEPDHQLDTAVSQETAVFCFVRSKMDFAVRFTDGPSGLAASV